MPMTTQQIYDTIVNHMRTQGNPWGAFNKRKWTYVNPNNPCERCAVGIISSIKLIDCYEGQKYQIAEMFGLIGRKLTSKELEMVLHLQYLFEFIPQYMWEYDFEESAQKYRLTYFEDKSILDSRIKNGSRNTSEKVLSFN